jgi:hypothetical protein
MGDGRWEMGDGRHTEESRNERSEGLESDATTKPAGAGDGHGDGSAATAAAASRTANRPTTRPLRTSHPTAPSPSSCPTVTTISSI